MDFIKAAFQDAVFEDGYMWVFDNLIQALCKININNFEMEIVDCYKGKEKFYARKIFRIQDKFYLAGQKSADILIYDRKKRGKEIAFCLQESTESDDSIKYVGFFLYNNDIYFFPKYIDNGIICFETSDRKFSKKRLLESSLRKKLEGDDLTLRCFSFYKDDMWFVLNRTGMYGKYNFGNGKADLYRTDSSNTLFSGICFDGDQIWLTETDNSNVICEGKQIIHILGEQSYWGIYTTEGGIFVPPYKSDKLIFIEKETLKVSIMRLPLTEREKEQVINHHFYDDGNLIYLFPLNSDPLFVFDKKKGSIQRFKLKCEGYIERCLKDKKVLLKEDEDINFKYLLRFYEFPSNLKNEQEKNKNEMGKIIWGIIQ